MFNEFHNEKFGLRFIIPSNEQVSLIEASKLIDDYIHKEMESLFKMWKSRKENADWKGDESSKKLNLFKQFHRSGSESVLWKAKSLGTEECQ
jgi:hypothetical protein